MKRFQVRQYITHYRSLTSLGLPIIIGQTGTILLSCADTLMIGHHGTDELAAAAFVNNMFNLVLLFGLGFSYGLTPIVGNLFGREQSPRIGETVKNALAANSLLALLLGAVVTMLYANIGNLGQPTELLPLMRPYLLVLFVSLPFVCWFNVFKQFSDGITDTRTPMWILLGGNILNIIGNYLLIYGKLGLPELGLFGAGISTMLSRVIMTIVFAAIFFLSKRYRIYRVGFIQGKVNRTAFLEQNKLGWPLALQMGMESAAFSLSKFFFLVYYGMGAAVAVRISYFNGQHDYTAARRSANAGFHLVLLIAMVVSLPVGLSRNIIGYLFSDSAEVCHLVAMTIIVLIVYQFGDGLQCVFSNALRGLSDVKPLMYIAFFAYFIVSLPLGYLFGITLNMGLVGVWLAFPFGLTTAGILYYAAFKRRLAKEISTHQSVNSTM